MLDTAQQSSSSRIIGVGVVALLHVAVIYVLVTSLAHRNVEAPRAPIEARIVTPAPETRPVAPPPPQPTLATPPPLFIPPPDVNIAKPPPPVTAPTVVTRVKPPPAPAPPAPAPAPATSEPVRALPRIDTQHSHELDYPMQARRLGMQGSVVLQVLVDADGRVTDAKLVTSSGSPILDQAALDGVKTSYRFLPGTVDGKPQPMWHTITVNWKLT